MSAMDTSAMLAEAGGAFGRGDWPAVERLCRPLTEGDRPDFAALILLGDAFAAQNRAAEAVAQYETAERLIPGHALAFTRLAVVRFRAAFGPAPSPRKTPDGVKRVQMNALGMKGGFGNQLLQYAFARLYADEFGYVAEFPDWIGRDLFDLDDPVTGPILPTIDERSADLFASLQRRSEAVHPNRNFDGFFLNPTSDWKGSQRAFRNLFAPGRKIAGLLDQAVENVEARGETIVAIHLRRAGFGRGMYWMAPPSWYLAWLDRIWPALSDPVLYVASDDPGAARDFARFAPLSAADLGVSIPGAEFMIDHYLLSQADHVALSNSTFSFTAAMLNDIAASFVRPDPNARLLREFDPWNAPVLVAPFVDPRGLSSADTNLVQALFAPEQRVVHYGRFCAPWTNRVRVAMPTLHIAEIEPPGSLDDYARAAGSARLDHVVVESHGDWPAFAQGAHRLIGEGAIGMIHLALDPASGGGITPDSLLPRERGYLVLKKGLVRVSPREPHLPLGPGDYVLAHQSVLSRLMGKP